MKDAKLKIHKDLGVRKHLGKKNNNNKQRASSGLSRCYAKKAIEGGKKGKTLMGGPSVFAPYL